MHDEIGLLVDTPRAGGSGTSNTGNTARKAFQNESKFAKILGIDPELDRQTDRSRIGIAMTLQKNRKGQKPMDLPDELL